MKEETASHPPALLWHLEGAQQLLKAEPRQSKETDPALATVHIAPPLLEKWSRLIVCFLFAWFTTTPSPWSAPMVSSTAFSVCGHCSPPLFLSRARR